MQIAPINNTVYKNSNFAEKRTAFGHSKNAMKESDYTFGKKALVFGTTALGVATSCAILAKRAGHSFLPKKEVFKDFKNLKNTYLGKVEFHDKEVIAIGAGSCLGGLLGGYLIDKNKNNRKAKNREAIMQIGNISIPIITVELFAKLGAKIGKVAKSLFAVAGIFVGIYLANFLMNKLTSFIFQDKTGERGVEATDFSAHLDDAVVAAQYVSSSKIIHYISRFVPAALMFAGNEVGNKQA